MMEVHGIIHGGTTRSQLESLWSLAVGHANGSEGVRRGIRSTLVRKLEELTSVAAQMGIGDRQPSSSGCAGAMLLILMGVAGGVVVLVSIM